MPYGFPYFCDMCHVGHYNEAQMKLHEGQEHDYCVDCNRDFINQNAYRMHMTSRIHRGAGQQCPFCQASFTSATGVAHHLERGACPRATNLNRTTLYQHISRRDTGGTITNRLLEYHGESTYEVNDWAWNGEAWECPLCNREFGQKRSLESHMNSPRHQAQLYHCPNKSACAKQFRSLGSLLNHLESESCGFTTYRRVQSGFNNLVASGRTIAWK